MGRSNRHDKLHRKVTRSVKKHYEPAIFVDHDADFASIKLAAGIEAKSYVKDGFVFCEDKNGKVIEVQVLNLSELAKRKSEPAA